jgi:hypothetical protein
MSTGSGPPGTVNPDQVFQKACQDLINKYIEGSIEEAFAIVRLHKLVSEEYPDKTDDDPELVAVFDAYVSQIREHSTRRAAAISGKKPEPAQEPINEANTSGQAGNPGPGAEDPTPENASGDGQTVNANQPFVSEPGSIAPRPLADLLAHVRKVDSEFTSFLSESVKKTQEVLTGFARNLKEADSFVMQLKGRPNLPNTQWKRLVRGQAIDLDAILTSHNSCVINDEERRELADGVEVIVHNGKPTQVKQVTTEGNWILTFRILRDAYTYIFPWRAEELREYEEFILKYYAAFPDSTSHDWIILYDRAVRNRIADGANRLELTDPTAFRDFESKYIGRAGTVAKPEREFPAALGAHKTNPRKRQRTDKSGQICRKWNWDTCERGNACDYIHACAKCGKRNNRAHDGSHRCGPGTRGNQA